MHPDQRPSHPSVCPPPTASRPRPLDPSAPPRGQTRSLCPVIESSHSQMAENIETAPASPSDSITHKQDCPRHPACPGPHPGTADSPEPPTTEGQKKQHRPPESSWRPSVCTGRRQEGGTGRRGREAGSLPTTRGKTQSPNPIGDQKDLSPITSRPSSADGHGHRAQSRWKPWRGYRSQGSSLCTEHR